MNSNNFRKISYFFENKTLKAKNEDGKELSNKETISKTIALFGATGGSGLCIIEEALLKGYKIIAAVRNPKALERFKDKIEIRIVDIYDNKSVKDAVKGADLIVSSIGTGGIIQASVATDVYSVTTRAILLAAENLKIDRLLFITSCGVDYDEGGGWFYNYIIKKIIMNTYMDMMKMETIVEMSDLKWTIARPSRLVDGTSKDFFGKERKIQSGTFSISRTDLAKFIIHEIENENWIHGRPALSYA